MTKTKILVTGGTGYIGSHTAVELIKEGYNVVIIDDLSNSKIETIDRINQITDIRPEFVQFDLCNKKKLSHFFKKHSDIDGIIHFAAYKAVGESVQFPLKYYRNNLDSLINILELIATETPKFMVFSSSCTVYGQPDKLPVTEDAPLKNAESPYGNTKSICEDILRDSCKSDAKLNAISLRYFNPVGAHSSSLIGERPKGVPNNLVPFITQTGAGVFPELNIFGGDYNTHDGTAIRDYIHVVDLAKAHVAAIKYLIDKENTSNYEHFNVGTGVGYSVLEMVKCFEKISGMKLNYRIVERRKGDIERIFAQTSIANTKLKWKATKQLEDMISSAWNWQKKLKQ